jgi:membrane peptidoglycan carboxypeptidase
MYSKEEILELYLNKVYFGDGLYGVEAAARGYFGKSAADIATEAALLAG